MAPNPESAADLLTGDPEFKAQDKEIENHLAQLIRLRMQFSRIPLSSPSWN